MASTPSNKGRFRVNPVEMAIFSAVSLIFINSLYNLFHDRSASSGLLAHSIASPAPQADRAPAAIEPVSNAPVSTLLATQEVGCQSEQKHQTSAGRLRLKGLLCGVQTPEESGNLLRTEVVNTANQVQATVFPDPQTLSYSTDYIPLVEGANSIRIDFHFKGKTTSQRLDVTRAPASR